MLRLTALILLFIGGLQGYGQDRKGYYQAEIGGGVTADRLPFWLHTNTFGKITNDTYLWGTVGVGTPFSKSNTRAFDYSFGFEGTGALGRKEHRIFIDQIYGRVHWQNLILDLGIIKPEIVYDGLSSTNGDMLYSTNSRSMPGINLHTQDFIKIPWIGKWLSFKFKYAEYIMSDNRYVDSPHLHNKLLAGKLTIIHGLSIEAGIEDYAQWGGKDPDNGKLKYSFKDYLDMVKIKSGGENATLSDQINKLGNHIGRHFAQINYECPKFKTTLFYNHIFADGSGMKYQNWPDGLYGLYFSRKENSRWFKSFVYEFYYTKNQSGPLHDRPATPEELAKQDTTSDFYGRIVLGGNDNYLNHGEYRSGWTLFGQTIGTPFFTPQSPVAGIVHGIYNNRFYAHHIGISGDLPLLNIQYKFFCSYSKNYGTYNTPFYNSEGHITSKSQTSLRLKVVVPNDKLPFDTTLDFGYDKGSLLKNNFGIMLSISKTGIFF